MSPGPSDLTIAICTIGRDGFLQAAIDSLFATTPAGVTLRIVLNAPDDPTLTPSIEDYVSAWDGPVSVSELESRLTIAGSHNTALLATNTSYVTFMGDDDLVLEPRVDRLLARFAETQPTPAVVGSFCRRVSGSANQPRFSTNKDYGPTTINAWETMRDSGELIEIVFPSAIYDTALLKSIGGFEERFGSAMDLATFTRLGLEHPVLADPRRTFAHRIHDGSVTSSSAGEHAARLRYTERCIDAVRNGETEPTWDDFVADNAEQSAVQRLRQQRETLSATMFRQGGAAIASGERVRGVGKVLTSAALSPSTFFSRSKSQVEREETGEPVVAILVKNTNRYRVPFYEQLRAELGQRGVELRLVVADGLAEDHAKGDRATLSWAEPRPLKEVHVRGRGVLWQPGFDIASGADLVITEQATKQLFNIALSFGQRTLHTRHAFWGHGRNFQASIEEGGGEGVKRRLTRRAHWFFAYNQTSADAAVDAGMPADRVTAVMNSTDTAAMRRTLASLPQGSAQAVRQELGIGAGPVGLYIGGLYAPKRPEFLIDAAIELRALIPDFELVVIGSGSQAAVVTDAADTHSWIHAIGANYDDDRIRLGSIASVALMPGMVGLNVVDGFALGLPTVTTDIDYHSPEIEYLVDGENGLIVSGDPDPGSYASAVAALLRDPDRLESLRSGAWQSGSALSIEDMTARFADGVEAALAAPRR